jgi:hypothetical protein
MKARSFLEGAVHKSRILTKRLSTEKPGLLRDRRTHLLPQDLRDVFLG